ncbi:MAG: phosphatidylcholine synthase [Hyphomicrobiaceae bacterium]|nr:phosphatidylcholine synthase [Hyphomicrobiaceae bacterium]
MIRVAAAWLVHIFTALGSVCALLAALDVVDGRLERAFAWLFLALVIDAVDGAFARAVRVTEVLPRFSGERLDLVIDYATYVLIPVMAMLIGGVLEGVGGRFLAALALLSALYHFADTESKADDNCFVGFPAVWNIVAFFMFAINLKGALAAMVVAALVLLTFVPMRWLHPMRVKRLLAVNIGVSAAGVLAGLWVLWHGFPAGPVAGGLIVASALYFLVLACLWPWIGTEAGNGDQAGGTDSRTAAD